MSGVFICYRRDDSAETAGRLYDRLVTACGAQLVLKNVDNIPPGVDFAWYVQQTLAHMTVLLVVIGQRWLEVSDRGVARINDPADHVHQEIQTALAKNLVVIPALVQQARRPRPHELRCWRGACARPL